MDLKSEDILFLESDNSCSYCGVKGREKLTVHHLDGNESNNDYVNQIVLCYTCHCRLHQGKGISPEEIGNTKKLLIHKTLTQAGVNALKIAHRNGFVIGSEYLLNHLVNMGFLKNVGYTLEQFGLNVLTRFELTPEGRSLLEKWLLD
jgi:hypothetical protein